METIWDTKNFFYTSESSVFQNVGILEILSKYILDGNSDITIATYIFAALFRCDLKPSRISFNHADIFVPWLPSRLHSLKIFVILTNFLWLLCWCWTDMNTWTWHQIMPSPTKFCFHRMKHFDLKWGHPRCVTQLRCHSSRTRLWITQMIH